MRVRSWLVLPWGAAKVEGKLVVGVPARDRLFATGTKSPDHVRGPRKLTSAAHQSESHTLSNKLYAWSESGWAVYLP